MTPTAVMETPLKESEQKALSVPEQADTLSVSTADQYLACEDYLALWKSYEDQIHADHDPIVKKADTLHKDAVALRKKYLEPIENGRRILKGKMITYQTEQERIRQEAQRRAEEESRKRAEEETLAAALQAEQEGDKATAEAILAEPVQVAPVIVPKTAPAPSRLSAGREVWSAEVTSLADLVKGIAHETTCNELMDLAEKMPESIAKKEILSFLRTWNSTAKRAPLNLVVENTTALNGMARSLKNSMAYPGVKAVCKRV